MINNNLDYEKNSNTTSLTTSTNGTSNLNISLAASLQNSNTNLNNIKVNSNSDSTHTTSMPTANGNSYFNRFDNRIAANLAAVLNGSRFRSSSCSSNKTTTPSSSATITATGLQSTPKRIPPSSTIRNPGNSLSAATTNRLFNNSFAKSSNHNLKDNNKPTFGSRHSLNGSRPSSPCPLGNSSGTMGRRRPLHLFTQANLNCNDNEKAAQTPSSDEDNSPTELNNCKRLADKPPLVKRLTMGLLRGNEESKPLVNNDPANSSANPGNSFQKARVGSCSEQLYSNGYINEEAFEPEKLIASKFGDSCRQSLTAIPMLDTVNLNDNSEFNLKKRYIRETSSANSSPKIFANRLRLNGAAAGRFQPTNSSSSSCQNTFDYNSDEEDLKDASWFQAGISRDIAEEILSSKSPGAFLVRKSSSKPGCYALTLRVPSPPGPKISNYIILRTTRGFKIKGFRKEFTSLKTLITHHSVMPELLPVPLAMPRPTNMTSSRRNLDDFDTYDSLQMLLKYLRAKNIENE